MIFFLLLKVTILSIHLENSYNFVYFVCKSNTKSAMSSKHILKTIKLNIHVIYYQYCYVGTGRQTCSPAGGKRR